MSEDQLQAHRAKATQLYHEDQPHEALRELAQATRIYVWLNMQKGNMPHMAPCIANNPKRTTKPPQPDTSEDRYASKRTYYLETPPPRDRRVAQAYEQIIARQSQRQMPAAIKF